MKLFTLLALIFSLSVFAQTGTMTTDETEAANAEASMSGASEETIDLREEEVQLQEDENYDPSLEIDQEKMDEYEEEVEY